MQDQTNQRLLTVGEAAEILRLKPSTVYKLVSTKRIPHRKLNHGPVRFTRTDLDEWIAGAAVAASVR